MYNLRRCMFFRGRSHGAVAQSCKSGRVLHVGPSSGLPCQNVSGPHAYFRNDGHFFRQLLLKQSS